MTTGQELNEPLEQRMESLIIKLDGWLKQLDEHAINEVHDSIDEIEYLYIAAIETIRANRQSEQNIISVEERW